MINNYVGFRGPARCPPPAFLLELEQLNLQMNIGMTLCKCRQPDLLLDIIKQQGAGRSLPWLISLVESNEGSLSVLPIQCICEFLLHCLSSPSTTTTPSAVDVDRISSRHNRKAAVQQISNVDRMEQMKGRLRDAIWNASTDIESVCNNG
jgi:integrator complex subunit 1